MNMEDFIRTRITELRLQKDVSEHRMSLELGRSGSYIRGISSGASLPSFKEFINILAYFDISPTEFFAPLDDKDTLYSKLCERLRGLDDSDLEKVHTFLTWIGK